MSLKVDVKRDLRAAQRMRLPWWAVLCWMGGCGAVAWALYRHGRLELALPLLNCLAVLGFAIVVKRDLRRQAWFWAAMAVLAALHGVAVLYIPWGDKWVPAVAIAVIDSMDLIIIFAILDAIGSYISRPSSSRPDRARASGPGARTMAPPRSGRGSRAARRP